MRWKILFSLECLRKYTLPLIMHRTHEQMTGYGCHWGFVWDLIYSMSSSPGWFWRAGALSLNFFNKVFPLRVCRNTKLQKQSLMMERVYVFHSHISVSFLSWISKDRFTISNLEDGSYKYPYALYILLFDCWMSLKVVSCIYFFVVWFAEVVLIAK